MKYFIVKQSGNYADEFDTEGFFLAEGKNLKEVRKSLEPSEDTVFPAEVYFGTNEAIEFEDLEEYLDSFEITEITKQQYDAIGDVIGDSFGHVSTID